LVEASLVEATNSISSNSDAKSSIIREPTGRFNLDTVIESEGANLSVGERSLLSLARALVKDSKVVILDEAT
jgi:ATP-binding cassette, subfamily C (CFTR/MRP), member 1